jgi:putative glutamine amidotransferase
MLYPLIGLTTSLRQDSPTTVLSGIRRTYVQAVLDAGGLPVLIPFAPEDVLGAILSRLDGLLLPGGVDVAPAYYGEQPHPKLGAVEPERDDLELTLCRLALAGDKALLAICRGIQVMNIAMGGTLYQDVPSQHPTDITHASNLSLPRHYIAHDVLIETGSILATLVGRAPLPVNSWHHQALKDIAPGLVVTGRAPDGIVEAAEVPGRRFAVGVQFHPEDLYPTDERLQRLFRGFVRACQ